MFANVLLLHEKACYLLWLNRSLGFVQIQEYWKRPDLLYWLWIVRTKRAITVTNATLMVEPTSYADPQDKNDTD